MEKHNDQPLQFLEYRSVGVMAFRKIFFFQHSNYPSLQNTGAETFKIYRQPKNAILMGLNSD